jgi:beta-fructofuranosidase
MMRKTEKDPYRPVYHFSPDNWMSDPIPFFYKGEYHIFFQYNPDGAFWDKMSWGHIISKDLIHWEQLPIALTPTPSGPDKDGCWTGCVIEKERRFYIFYTGVYPQVLCVASSENLVKWEKYKDNPLNIKKPAGYGDCFRDPCIWRGEDAWYMIVGGEKLDRRGGILFLYKSSNFIDWIYSDILFEGDMTTGFEFECPDFFLLGRKYVLLTSCERTWWHIGGYSDYKFYRENFGLVDGGAIYAAKSLKDVKGRRILWGWIREERSKEDQIQNGWSGVLSLPRELKLLSDGTLSVEVIPELKSLRGKNYHIKDIKIGNENGPCYYFIKNFEGYTFEIIAQFDQSAASEYGVIVRCSPDLECCIKISYNQISNQFCGVPIVLNRSDLLSVRIFVDYSVVEAFANSKCCYTSRTYPERDDCLSVALYSIDGDLKVKDIDIWEINKK